jgi:hypothetical protein
VLILNGSVDFHGNRSPFGGCPFGDGFFNCAVVGTLCVNGNHIFFFTLYWIQGFQKLKMLRFKLLFSGIYLKKRKGEDMN